MTAEVTKPTPDGLLRCTVCGRLMRCSADEVGGFIRSGWPECCDEVMTYSCAVERPTSPPPPLGGSDGAK
jgi:hypothetical protein